MQQKGARFTIRYNGLSRQLVSDVRIISAVDENGNENRDFSGETEFKALWDTGASCSLISPSVAQKLQLASFGKERMMTPSGEAITNVYCISVLLPNDAAVGEVIVFEGIPASFDMLIGMDIIGLGDFAVSNYSGKTTFSFRIPSGCEIDFVNHSYLMPRGSDKIQGRNEPCACGSGKKYKNCCGSRDK
jgi:predicted aspartyl protease